MVCSTRLCDTFRSQVCSLFNFGFAYICVTGCACHNFIMADYVLRLLDIPTVFLFCSSSLTLVPLLRVFVTDVFRLCAKFVLSGSV